jgi:sugar phosphate permease
MNVTEPITGINAMSSISQGLTVWLITAIVFVVIVAAIFALVKSFRYFLYGLTVIIPATLIGWFSHTTADSAVNGDMTGIWIVVYAVGGIAASIGAGYLVRNWKWIQKIEKGMK